MKSKEILRWGILGPGKIANAFAKDLSLVENVLIQGVGSRNLERASTFAQTFNIPKAYGSYEELLSDPLVDIIYISTPHDSHLEWSEKAMQAGKHVLCEKPLAVNSQQVQQLISTAKQNKVFLMEAFWSRFNPCIREALEKIQSGTIGAVNFVQANFSFAKEAPPESRMFNLDLAGGSLLDVGVYPIFLAYMVFGMPDEILANARFHESGADSQMSAIFKYKNGMANLMSGFISKSDMRACIMGTKGRIYLNPRWHEAQSYTLVLNDESQTIEKPSLGKGYSHEIEECYHCIQNGQLESTLWSHQNSLDLIQICDEIRRQIGLKYPFEK